MEDDIQSFCFFVIRNTEPDNTIQDLEDNKGSDEIIDDGCHNTDKLLANLGTHADTFRQAGTAKCCIHEHAGQYRADDTTYCMYTKGVE